jgi:anti-sigma B factor antagonist
VCAAVLPCAFNFALGVGCAAVQSSDYAAENLMMSTGESRLRVKRVDNISHVEFVDRNILDEGNIQIISNEISELIDAEATPRLLISFANVEHLSSAALGALIKISVKTRAKQGQLRLANIDPQIYEVFVITRLNKLFQIHETTDEAMKSFTA